MRVYIHCVVVIATLVVTALGGALSTFAQESPANDYGILSISVQDESNQPIAYASVDIRNASGDEYNATTQEDGKFKAKVSTQAAPFTLCVSAGGYIENEVHDIYVSSEKNQEVIVMLKLAKVSDK
jgi:hypothetical protein